MHSIRCLNGMTRSFCTSEPQPWSRFGDSKRQRVEQQRKVTLAGKLFAQSCCTRCDNAWYLGVTHVHTGDVCHLMLLAQAEHQPPACTMLASLGYPQTPPTRLCLPCLQTFPLLPSCKLGSFAQGKQPPTCTMLASSGRPVRRSKPASTNCSASTSLATCPLKLTPRLR